MTNFSADIFEALGRTDAAAALRWGETPESHGELTEERDALDEELSHAEGLLARLEAMLCKRCERNWKEQQ